MGSHHEASSHRAPSILAPFRFELQDADSTRTFDCGDYVMVLNPLSWDTHVVSLIVYLVVESLRTGPKTAAEILPFLGETDLAPESLHQRVEEALEELQRFGIVCSSPRLRSGVP